MAVAFAAARVKLRTQAWLAAVVLSLSLTAAAQQPAAPLSHLDQQFYAALAAGARQSGDSEKTENVGAATGGAFCRDLAGRRILVGFDVWEGVKAWLKIHVAKRTRAFPKE
jgi:hypothetical protein